MSLNKTVSAKKPTISKAEKGRLKELEKAKLMAQDKHDRLISAMIEEKLVGYPTGISTVVSHGNQVIVSIGICDIDQYPQKEFAFDFKFLSYLQETFTPDNIECFIDIGWNDLGYYEQICGLSDYGKMHFKCLGCKTNILITEENEPKRD
jgi:hypothetical protein